MRIKLLPILLTFTAIILASDVYAQFGRGAGLGKFTQRKRYYSIGTSFNTMHYFGDIVPKNRVGSLDFDFTRPNLGFFVQRRYWPRVTFRLAATWGQLAGEDEVSADPNDLENGGFFRYKRNLHFRNNVYDLTFTTIIDLFANDRMSGDRRTGPIPYLMFGFGGFYHNPQAIRPEGFEGSRWVNLRPLRTENQDRAYSAVSVNFPVGIGVRIRLTESLDLALESGWRFTLTDYLDDVSGDYLDLGTFSDPLVRALHDRSAEPRSLLSGRERSPNTITYVSQVDGNTYTVVAGYGQPNNRRGAPDKDAYLVTGFQLSYIFPTGRKPPKFR
jgi:hypothetical protein